MTKGDTIVERAPGTMQGVFTGAAYKCRLEGCNGRRLAVKWEDGKHTHPCSRGLVVEDGKWRIG